MNSTYENHRKILTGPMVKRLPLNELGRDFVVGDLHGAYESLDRAMCAAQFDPTVDRLLSVGDLIDRGADSARALEYLRQPYFHFICGNHDYAFLRMKPQDVALMARINFNQLGWAAGLSQRAIGELQVAMSACSLVMEVETRTGVLGLVHADVPAGMSWPEFVDSLEANNLHTLAVAMEGRLRAMDVDAAGVAGIDRVIVGHTPMYGGPVRRGNVWMIDTGAIYRQDGVIVSGFDVVKGMLSLINVEASDQEIECGACSDDGVLIVDRRFEMAGCNDSPRERMSA